MRHKIRFEQIMEEVKQNLSKLDNCKKHNFLPADGSSKVGRGGKHVCIHCGGEVEANEARWYRRGLAHA